MSKDWEEYEAATAQLRQHGMWLWSELTKTSDTQWFVMRHQHGVPHERVIVTGPHKTWQAARDAALRATDL